MLLVALAVPRPAADVEHLLDGPLRGQGDDGATAHALLRLLVAQAGLPAAPTVRRCRLCGGPHGAPVRPDCSLSLAHTAGLVAAALSTTAPVGVDVEQASAAAFAGFPAVALGHGEADGTPPERARLWARKEAALKAAGTGLTVDPRQVRMTAATAPPALLSWPLEDLVRLVDLPAPQGWACALAVLSDAAVLPVVLDGDALLSAAAPGAERGRPRSAAGRRGQGRAGPGAR